MERKKIVIYAFLAFMGLAVIFIPGFSELMKLKEENADARKRIKMLEQRNTTLESEINRLENDPEYVEEKAREKLGILKKGEYIYRGTAQQTTKK